MGAAEEAEHLLQPPKLLRQASCAAEKNTGLRSRITSIPEERIPVLWLLDGAREQHRRPHAANQWHELERSLHESIQRLVPLLEAFAVFRRRRAIFVGLLRWQDRLTKGRKRLPSQHFVEECKQEARRGIGTGV